MRDCGDRPPKKLRALTPALAHKRAEREWMRVGGRRGGVGGGDWHN